MFKKILSLTLIALVINVFGVGTVRAGAQVVEQARPNVERVKENVRKLGIGDATRLQLKLWDGRNVKGYLREAREEDFTVVDVKTGVATTVKYAEVKQVKGSNRSTAAKVGVNLAKGAAMVGALALGLTLFTLIFVRGS